MITTVTSLIARARAYVDDEHAGVQNWLPDATWLAWANVEWATLYRKLLSTGLVGPTYTDETVTATGAASYTLTGRPMAIVGVYKGPFDTAYRELTPAQIGDDRFPSLSTVTGEATSWTAHGTGSSVTLTLHPRPSGGDYVVRYVQEPDVLVVSGATSGQSTSINCPAGVEDRVVLGMAKRGLIKEGSGSAAIERLIAIADEDIAFLAHNRIVQEPPRAKNRNRPPLAMERGGYNTDPRNWMWV